MIEFELGGQKYRTVAKLDAFTQNLVVKRLAPFFGTLVKVFRLMQQDPAQGLASILNAVASIPDDDLLFIQKTCLGIVMRQTQGEVWARVLPPGGVLAFEDISLLDMNEIVVNVLRENLSGFFSDL